jgi:hypothetical protein
MSENGLYLLEVKVPMEIETSIIEVVGGDLFGSYMKNQPKLEESYCDIMKWSLFVIEADHLVNYPPVISLLYNMFPFEASTTIHIGEDNAIIILVLSGLNERDYTLTPTKPNDFSHNMELEPAEKATSPYIG